MFSFFLLHGNKVYVARKTPGTTTPRDLEQTKKSSDVTLSGNADIGPSNETFLATLTLNAMTLHASRSRSIMCTWLYTRFVVCREIVAQSTPETFPSLAIFLTLLNFRYCYQFTILFFFQCSFGEHIYQTFWACSYLWQSTVDISSASRPCRNNLGTWQESSYKVKYNTTSATKYRRVVWRHWCQVQYTFVITITVVIRDKDISRLSIYSVFKDTLCSSLAGWANIITNKFALNYISK